MVISETPRDRGFQGNESGVLFPKLPKETIIAHQKDLKEKTLKHPLYLEALRKTAKEKGFKIPTLSEPFEFEDTTEISNNDITFKYERDDKDPKIRKFKVIKRFSLSGPMQYENDFEDRGPFVVSEMCLTYGSEPHISYSWRVSDKSVKPQHFEDTQKAVDECFKFLEFLPF